MSKLSEYLKLSRTPANPARAANLSQGSSREPARISSSSKISSDPELESAIRRMAKRWQYSDEELADVLQRAANDPDSWRRAVAADERREAEFRERGLLPKAGT